MSEIEVPKLLRRDDSGRDGKGPMERDKAKPASFRDKKTGEARKFYVWLPSGLLRDDSLSTDARFLLALLRTFTHKYNEPAYPSDCLLRRVTGWSRGRLANALREVKHYPGVESRFRKEGGRFTGRNIFLPKCLFHDRSPDSVLR